MRKCLSQYTCVEVQQYFSLIFCHDLWAKRTARPCFCTDLFTEIKLAKCHVTLLCRNS